MSAVEQPEQRAEATGVPTDSTEAPRGRHVDNRTLVFPDLKILYVPVPKAGCTAIMWALAEASEVDEERFYNSYYREVTRSLTIHDLSRWPDEFVFAKLPQEQKNEILNSEEWMRFTVVRHPIRRVWSAWQSKILLAEPQFVEKFSDAPWFPGSVSSGREALEMFRQFLKALESDPELVDADVHWAPQVPLISYGELPYTKVGRVEKLGETMELVSEHLRALDKPALPELPRTNVTPLRYLPELFDEGSLARLTELFGDDLREFDYDPPTLEEVAGEPPESWIESVDAVTSALQSVRDRNERVGDLQRLFRIKREELYGRVGQQRDRIERQKGRIERQKERITRQDRLRRDELRRNRRLQERLKQTTRQVERMKNSASWRYTAPLRRLSQFARKTIGRGRSNG